MSGPGDTVKLTFHSNPVLTLDDKNRVLDVTEDSTSPYTFMWDGREYRLNPGETGYVPWDLIRKDFGDPRATTKIQPFKDELTQSMSFIADRATEVRRLNALYSAASASESEVPYAPRVTVTDLDDNPISTVVDDPLGDAITPVVTTVLEREALLTQLQRQQAQLEALTVQLNLTRVDDKDQIFDPKATLGTPVTDDFTLPEDK